MEDVFGNRIELADQSKVDVYALEMQRVLAAVAFFMSDKPQEWLKKVWVSDMSTVSDFGLSSADLFKISDVLKTPVRQGDSLWRIAQRIREVKTDAAG